jgi:hypothetical protein
MPHLLSPLETKVQKAARFCNYSTSSVTWAIFTVAW